MPCSRGKIAAERGMTPPVLPVGAAKCAVDSALLSNFAAIVRTFPNKFRCKVWQRACNKLSGRYLTMGYIIAWALGVPGVLIVAYFILHNA